jgi:phage terminase small subunit
MPPLDNPRWEHFAQELAKGHRAQDAYVAAGYKANPGNATRLKLNEKIFARVKELLDRSAARAEVTVASLLNELEEARKLAAEINQPSAAVAATLGKAKVAGLIVDRKEVGKPGDFEGMNVDELRDYITREAARLGIGVQDAGEEGEGGSVGGQLN